jgi:hypothetical protein
LQSRHSAGGGVKDQPDDNGEDCEVREHLHHGHAFEYFAVAPSALRSGRAQLPD